MVADIGANPFRHGEELLHYLGMFGREVGLFTGIIVQVIELWRIHS